MVNQRQYRCLDCMDGGLATFYFDPNNQREVFTREQYVELDSLFRSHVRPCTAVCDCDKGLKMLQRETVVEVGPSKNRVKRPLFPRMEDIRRVALAEPPDTSFDPVALEHFHEPKEQVPMFSERVEPPEPSESPAPPQEQALRDEGWEPVAVARPNVYTVNLAKADALGSARRELHLGSATSRVASADCDVVGVAGELAFAQFSGLAPDLSTRPAGDSGVDFSFTVNGRLLTVDVKTARKPTFLFVKEADIERAAAVLVLARLEGDTVEFFGWEQRSTMAQAPVKDFGYGIRNHHLHHSKLRPMATLSALLARRTPNSPAEQ